MDAELRALADPRRRDIVALVWGRELAAGDIAARFDVTRPAISQHLGVLREAGLIRERRDGTRRLYRASPERLSDVVRFLETFWDEGLDRLKQAAEAEQRQEPQDARRHDTRDIASDR